MVITNWALQGSIIKCDNLKMYLGFCNGVLQSYETDNKSFKILHILDFFFFFFPSMPHCSCVMEEIPSFHISYSCLSRIKHLSLLLKKGECRSQGWERCCFDSHLGTVRHCEPLRQGDCSITQNIPSLRWTLMWGCVGALGVVWQGSTFCVLFKMDSFRCRALKNKTTWLRW